MERSDWPTLSTNFLEIAYYNLGFPLPGPIRICGTENLTTMKAATTLRPTLAISSSQPNTQPSTCCRSNNNSMSATKRTHHHTTLATLTSVTTKAISMSHRQSALRKYSNNLQNNMGKFENNPSPCALLNIRKRTKLRT